MEASVPPVSPRPTVWTWYVVYCVLLSLLYLACVGLGLVFLVLDPEDLEMQRTEALISGVALAGFGLLFFVPVAIAPFLPIRPWHWIYGLVIICMGLTSCCTWPLTVPLLIYWIKPENKAYFGRADAGTPQSAHQSPMEING